MKNNQLIIAIAIWSIIIIASLVWNIITVNNNAIEVIENKASAFFDEIQTTRQWNASHGGVYVPITAKTQPNPYLKVKNRDVITIDSVELTK